MAQSARSNMSEDIESRNAEKRILAFDILGYSIFVGCNAQSNELLVSDHKQNHPACLWMHVVGRRGPHVVLCLAKAPTVPVANVVMRYAASRALKFSGLKNGQVLYAPLEDVFKPERAREGIYRTWRTDCVEL